MTRSMTVLLIALAQIASASDLPPDNPAMTAAAGKVVEQQVQLSPELAEALKDIRSLTESSEFQARQHAARATVNQLLGTSPPPDADTDKSQDHPHRAVLFVSASMPIATLRNYARDLDQVDGVMVLRGLIGGMRKIGPTAEFVAAVLKVDPGCVGAHCVMRRTPLLIDPLLFRANGITQVPALAFQPDMELQTYCNRAAGAEVPTSKAIIYGDAALSGLVAEYARLTGDVRAKRLLKELDNG